MSEADVSAILTKLESMEKEMAHVRDNVGRIFERMDKQAEQGHQVRIGELERRMNGLWTKVISLVTLISGTILGLFQLLKKAG